MEELQKHLESFSKQHPSNRAKTPNSKSSINSPDKSAYISIGTIASSHGIKGWAKVKNFGDSWMGIHPPFPIHLVKKASPQTKTFTLTHFEIKPNYILISVDGVNFPEYWDEWRSAEIQISQDIIPVDPLKKDEFYIFQLENLKVFDESNQDTGYTVQEITETPAHFILVLSNSQRKILVPFLNEWVGEVNLEHKFLVVKGWESWLEI